MADSYVQVAPDGSGKKMDTEQLTVGAETVDRQRVMIAGAAAAALASVGNADAAADAYGMVVRLPDPEVSEGPATLDALDEAVQLEIKGRRVVGIYVTGALSADMDLIVEHSTDGVNWGEKFFWNGDHWVVFDELPHNLNNYRWYSVITHPGIKYIRVRVNRYGSGSVTATIYANDQDDPTIYAGVGGFQDGPTALGALNDAVHAWMYKDAPGFFVEAGNLAGTLVVEGSPEMQGSLWIPTVFYANSQWRLSTGYAVSSPATGFTVSPLIDPAFCRYRLRVSAYTSGSCDAHGRAVNSHDMANRLITATIPDTPVPFFSELVGGHARTNEGTAVAAGDLAAMLVDRLGKLITLPYALPDDDVLGFVTKTSTAAQDIVAAQGAGVRSYLTSITLACGGTSETAVIYDGATQRFAFVLAANQVVHLTFPKPLRGSANTAWRAAQIGTNTVNYTFVGYKSAV